MASDLAFPEGFVWGTSTAAHQIEGGNVNNDWWVWEHLPGSGCADSSADACDSLHRWLEDVELVESMGLGAYRFSLEWSRIEPAEGEFSIAALDYYRRICMALRERNISPVVTFHHFTTPRWLSERGGWEAPDSHEAFSRFVTQGDCTPRRRNRLGMHDQRAEPPRGKRLYQGILPSGVEGRLRQVSGDERSDVPRSSSGS